MSAPASIAAAVPPVSGLMSRKGTPGFPQDETFMSSAVLYINWDEIETAPGVYSFAIFDTRLADLTAHNISNVKVRIYGGDTAPYWVKRLGSATGFFNSPYIAGAKDCASGPRWGGVSVQNVKGPMACIPFFWKAEYQAAYKALMQALSIRLENLPNRYLPVTTIVDSSCMAVYAEVFYRGQGSAATNHTLIDAGLTAANDWACQKAAIDVHALYFKGKRRTALAINNWDVMDPTSPSTYRTAAWSNAQQGVRGTYDFITTVALPALGADLELQNNGLHASSSPSAACSAENPSADYFCYLKFYGHRNGFQTETYIPCDPANPGSCSATGASQTLLDDLNNGIEMNAQFIELPVGMTTRDWNLMPCFNHQIVSGTLQTSCPQ